MNLTMSLIGLVCVGLFIVMLTLRQATPEIEDWTKRPWRGAFITGVGWLTLGLWFLWSVTGWTDGGRLERFIGLLPGLGLIIHGARWVQIGHELRQRYLRLEQHAAGDKEEGATSMPRQVEDSE